MHHFIEQMLVLVSCPELVNAVHLRTVFRVVIEYFTFCRFNRFSHLDSSSINLNTVELNTLRGQGRTPPAAHIYIV